MTRPSNPEPPASRFAGAPRLRAQHVNPEEAVKIHRELNVAQSIAIHWGTFVLTTEPFDQPPRDLAAALARAHLSADRFVTFKHGEMRVLSRGPRAGENAQASSQIK